MGVQLGQDALHAQSGVDVVTGLQSKVRDANMYLNGLS